jgi:hypothetical protein
VIKKQLKSNRPVFDTVKKACRILGLLLVLPFFIWLPLSLVTDIPSIIDVFGPQGLRTPTGFVIAGLMLAAFGFEDFENT